MSDAPSPPSSTDADTRRPEDSELAVALKLALVAAVEQRQTDPILDHEEQTAFIQALVAFVQAADRFAGVTQVHTEVHRRYTRVLHLSATRLEEMAVHPPAHPTGLSPEHAAQLLEVTRQCRASARHSELLLLARRWPAAEPGVAEALGVQTATLRWATDTPA